jgi:hypothetical protein
MYKKASPIVELKRVLDNGAIIQIKVWRLPSSSHERPHGLKYSLFYGRPGERIIGYDNEVGKGDHRHHRELEERYLFTTLEQLIADFERDVELEMLNERNADQGRE